MKLHPMLIALIPTGTTAEESVPDLFTKLWDRLDEIDSQLAELTKDSRDGSVRPSTKGRAAPPG